MEIHTHSFCGISTSQDWQSFLAEVDPELHAELMITLGMKKGCRTNSRKMQEIYVMLYKRGKGQAFEDFITRRFPWLIKSTNPANPNKVLEKPRFKTPKVKVKDYTPTEGDLNKHQVFRSYQPAILSFPQKLIMAGQPKTLYHRVQAFVRDKIAVDYLIIEDRAYIEYFHPKYANVVNKISRESREIFKYRKKQKQNG